MKLIVPDYYKDFTCIADKCRHSCCIGWEIDIDADTYEYYKSVPGDFGDRLRSGICHGDVPCLKLCHDDRCAFLNEQGLCDIILTLGEDSLCDICTDHPRFRNFYSDRTEMGLGLCCEEACRIILGRKTPVTLVTLEDDGCDTDNTDAEYLAERDAVISAITDRSIPLAERFAELAEKYGITNSTTPPTECADFYRTLERLDPAWDIVLDRLCSVPALAVPDGTIWENFVVYLVFRYSGDYALADALSFAVHTTELLCTIASEDFGDVCETCRMWSSEIEYSDENIERILDWLTI